MSLYDATWNMPVHLREMGRARAVSLIRLVLSGWRTPMGGRTRTNSGHSAEQFKPQQERCPIAAWADLTPVIAERRFAHECRQGC
jgi:hypothetical protein